MSSPQNVSPADLLAIAQGLIEAASQITRAAQVLSEPRLYTIQDVADRLRQSDRTIRDAIEAGTLRVTHELSARGQRISHTELLRYMDAFAVEAAA